MKKQDQNAIREHLASAKIKDVHISTKHSVEICRHLRYKTTNLAKKILEGTIALKKPTPFKRFKRNVGHKAGMAAGRFPEKAAKEMLRLIKAAETNAQFKGLNTANLKITKLLANKASIPVTGGRQRYATKRTSLEIEVMETKLSSKNEKGLEKSKTSQREKKKAKENKKEEKKTEEKPTETPTPIQKEKTPQKLPKEGLEESKSPQRTEEVKKEEEKPTEVKKEIKKETPIEEKKEEEQPKSTPAQPASKEETKKEDKSTGEQTK